MVLWLSVFLRPEVADTLGLQSSVTVFGAAGVGLSRLGSDLIHLFLFSPIVSLIPSKGSVLRF